MILNKLLFVVYELPIIIYSSNYKKYVFESYFKLLLVRPDLYRFEYHKEKQINYLIPSMHSELPAYFSINFAAKDRTEIVRMYSPYFSNLTNNLI